MQVAKWRMSASEAFFDNIVVLDLLSADQAQADRAEDLLSAGGSIGVQVLNEFVAVARRRLGMPWAEASDCLDHIRLVCPVHPLTIETHDRARVLAERCGVSIHVALIVAAALMAGCKTLYAEDLQDGQRFERQLTVRDPFRAAPS